MKYANKNCEFTGELKDFHPVYNLCQKCLINLRYDLDLPKIKKEKIIDKGVEL